MFGERLGNTMISWLYRKHRFATEITTCHVSQWLVCKIPYNLGQCLFLLHDSWLTQTQISRENAVMSFHKYFISTEISLFFFSSSSFLIPCLYHHSISVQIYTAWLTVLLPAFCKIMIKLKRCCFYNFLLYLTKM